jgi:anti-anti-sigma regulatory factor
MVVESRQPSGEIVISVEGTFDAVAAWQLRGRLGGIPSAERVVLDFTQVRDFADLGIAVVANGLAEAQLPRVEMRGLREHQHRLFRYFGVDVDALASVSANPALVSR